MTTASFFLLFAVIISTSSYTAHGQASTTSTLDRRPDDLPLFCPICRSNDRPILNPNHSFTMVNGITWTCKYLQETVQDVDMNGWESEQIMCRHAQLQAENHGCLCGGPALPPISEQIHDINPTCDMCATTPGAGTYGIPFGNRNKLVNTGVVGTHNCQGLFDALADGIMSANLCPSIQAIAGTACCLDPHTTTNVLAANTAAAATTATSTNSNSNTQTFTSFGSAAAANTLPSMNTAGAASQTSTQYMIPPSNIVVDNPYAINYNTGIEAAAATASVPTSPPANPNSCQMGFAWCDQYKECIRLSRESCPTPSVSSNGFGTGGRLSSLRGGAAEQQVQQETQAVADAIAAISSTEEEAASSSLSYIHNGNPIP